MLQGGKVRGNNEEIQNNNKTTSNSHDLKILPF
jgi:hypothetical protein